MMTLEDVVKAIEEAKLKRDFTHELTPANKEILRKMGGGTFEAVLTGKGDEKCLIPEVGTLQYLYRGQNKEFIPCVPTIFRGNPLEEEIFIERMRLEVFRRLLNSHPVIVDFFKRHNFKVDYEGLAQHYGLKTSVLDLTSSLDVALFFALCKYNRTDDRYSYYDDGLSHEAILYVFDPIIDNEPTPSLNDCNYMNGNITPIGLQAFPRPGIQQGYALHISKGESVKCWMYRYSFTCDDSKYYYDKFNGGKSIVGIEDALVGKGKKIASQRIFSTNVFERTYAQYRPNGITKAKLKKHISKEVLLRRKVEDIIFDSRERQLIIEDWNGKTGAKMADLIRRKPWFECDEINEDKDKFITGMRNSQDYRTLKRISRQQMLKFFGNPNAPEGALWVNYTGKPRPRELPTANDGKWIEIPASMENLFGKKYLTESDWKIDAK